jgi:molybdopterin converting factor subunit 1
MKVKVFLFAGLREKAGKGEVLLDLPEGSSLSAIRKNLNLEMPTWSSLAFAVNQTYVPSDTSLNEGDEVALIPPVAGG